MGCLGSSTGIFWNSFFILKTYILQHSITLCSKAFSQQPTKYMVAPRKTDYSVVEFDGSGKRPPILPSSQYNWCYFSCASIEHMILYISFLAFLINPSNTFPCKFLQLYLLYQGPPVTHYELCLSISYCNCHVFQLLITYQHGVKLYSMQKLWLYLGMWYSNYPHLSFFFSTITTPYSYFFCFIFINSPPYYTNI